MYRTSDGEELFIVDGHTHFWDAAPANQRNIHGKQFIDCFYAYHSALSPEQEVWPKEKFEKYDAETMVNDLFVDGPVDMAIIQPTYLKEFYIEGFNTTEQNAVITQAHPDRFILNGSFDPREGTAALEHLHALKEKLDAMLAREGRTALARACFDFLPHRARLDLEGWPEVDIFAHD